MTIGICLECGHPMEEGGACPKCAETLAEVIVFPTALPPDRASHGGPITRKAFRHHACSHKQIEIDDKLRVVECRSCHERLDPIEVLLNWRSYWIQINNARAALEKEHARLERDRARRTSKKTKGTR